MWSRIRVIVSALLLISIMPSCSKDRADDAGIQLWGVEYDDSGLVRTIAHPGGQTTKIIYEFKDENQQQVGRLMKQTGDEKVVSYSFDDFGRRVEMSDAAGRVRYAYDGFGHLKTVQREADPLLDYGYDTMGRITSISLGPKLSIGYEYDFLGRLSKIATPAGDITYEYRSAPHEVVRTFPNGLRTIWKFQHGGNLVSTTHLSKSHPLLRYSYKYRPDNLINELKEWSPEGEKILTYTYDTVQRLVSVSDTLGQTIRYAYDQFGNRTEVDDGSEEIHAEFAPPGQLIKFAQKETTHDAGGNLTSYFDKDSQVIFDYYPNNWHLSQKGQSS